MPPISLIPYLCLARLHAPSKRCRRRSSPPHKPANTEPRVRECLVIPIHKVTICCWNAGDDCGEYLYVEYGVWNCWLDLDAGNLVDGDASGARCDTTHAFLDNPSDVDFGSDGVGQTHDVWRCPLDDGVDPAPETTATAFLCCIPEDDQRLPPAKVCESDIDHEVHDAECPSCDPDQVVVFANTSSCPQNDQTYLVRSPTNEIDDTVHRIPP